MEAGAERYSTTDGILLIKRKTGIFQNDDRGGGKTGDCRRNLPQAARLAVCAFAGKSRRQGAGCRKRRDGQQAGLTALLINVIFKLHLQRETRYPCQREMAFRKQKFAGARYFCRKGVMMIPQCCSWRTSGKNFQACLHCTGSQREACWPLN